MLNTVKYPHKVYCIGAGRDKILNGSIDFKNRSLKDVVRLIHNAEMYVGIHSSMTCLAMYIPKVKAIIAHFGFEFLKFGNYNKNFIDVMPDKYSEIQELLDAKKTIL